MGYIRLWRRQFWGAEASEARPALARSGPIVFGRGFALSAQPHFLPLSSSIREERAGERRSFLSGAPLSDSLPARSSQRERGSQSAVAAVQPPQ